MSAISYRDRIRVLRSLKLFGWDGNFDITNSIVETLIEKKAAYHRRCNVLKHSKATLKRKVNVAAKS